MHESHSSTSHPHRRRDRSQSRSTSRSRSTSGEKSRSRSRSRSRSHTPNHTKKSKKHKRSRDSRSRSRSHSPTSFIDPHAPHPLAHLYAPGFLIHAYTGIQPPPPPKQERGGREGRGGGRWRDKRGTNGGGFDHQQPYQTHPPPFHPNGFAPPMAYQNGYQDQSGFNPPPVGFEGHWMPAGVPPPFLGASSHLPPPPPPPPSRPPPPPPRGAFRIRNLDEAPQPAIPGLAPLTTPPSSLPLPPPPPTVNPFNTVAGGVGRPSLILGVEHTIINTLRQPLGPVIERQFMFKRADTDRSPVTSELFRDPIEPMLPVLGGCKENLNCTKAQISSFDLSEWDRHTNFTNICGFVSRQVRQVANPELCTNAFLKMYEMLVAYEIVPSAERKSEQTTLNTVHLCEAPGGFISAMNHYLRTEIHPTVKWQWKGVTLNPSHAGNKGSGMIEDDQLIKVKPDHWMMGVDDTGDIRPIENIKEYWRVAKEMGPIQVVTCDGSISCVQQPGEQEALTAQLHYCEMVCGLGLLAKGGSLVLKMFTFFEYSSLNLLYLLHTLFSSVTVTKPACSKGGNSETYIVALDFQGIDPELLARLLSQCGPSAPSTMMLPRSLLSATFLNQVYNCAEYFVRCSAEVINRNVSLFTNKPEPSFYPATEALRQAVADEFMKRFKLRPLDTKAERLFR